ncbi:MAG TPA: polysaccharide deacetylase family protein [Candidatus Nitrosotalea sp.]|nr:polysaccharide deacetylase family protein [Candidatus Nitrosotalea sp.]
MYHHVSPSPGLVTVSPEMFARQMEYIHRAGYETLSTDRFLAFLKGRGNVPAKSVLITFDDGYLDNFVHAFPVLKQYGLQAVIFLVTGWIGDGPTRSCASNFDGSTLPPTPDHRECKAAIRSGRADEVMLRWSEVKVMAASGAVEFHSHTHRHIRWDHEYPDAAKRLGVLEADLRESREVLHQRLGKPSVHLCWPWGCFDSSYQQLARNAGFEVQYTVAKGINVRGGNPEHVARVVVKDRSGFWFASRLWMYRHSLIGAAYARLLRERDAG